MNEVVLASSLREGMTFAWDIETGTLLFTFHNNACMPRTLNVVNSVRDKNGTLEPEYLLAAQTDKSSINIWALGKDRPLHRSNVAEPMISLVTSQNGTLAIGGGSSGKCYAWDITTGELLRVWNAHYKAVSAVCFSDCGSILFTGGEDAIIHSWRVYEIVDMEKYASADDDIRPIYTINSHSLPISDICTLGHTGQATTPILSVSLDGTARMHDTPSGKALFHINTTVGLYCARADPLGQKVFLGATDGHIYEVALHQAALQQSSELQVANHLKCVYDSIANDDGGVSFSSADTHNNKNLSDQNDGKHLPVFIGLESPVTDLAVSSCGSYLLSTSEDGLCCIWDITSRQRLRTLQNNKASTAHTEKTKQDSKNGRSDAMTSLLVLPKSCITRESKKEAQRGKIDFLKKFPTPPHMVKSQCSGEPVDGGSLREYDIRLPIQEMPPTDSDQVTTAFHDELLVHLDGYQETPSSDTNEQLSPKDQEIESLKQKVASLEEENSRWKNINERLKKLHEKK